MGTDMSDLIPREKRLDHGKQDHDEMIEFGLLDDGQPTEYATWCEGAPKLDALVEGEQP